MRRQLLIPFIECVDGAKERGRVRRMKHHRKIPIRGLLKDRRKPLIVDAKQLSLRISDGQAKILPELDATRAMLDEALQAVDRDLNEIIALNSRPVHPSHRGEAVLVGSAKFLQDIQRRIPGPHGDVHDLLDAALIHDLQNGARLLRVKVVVIINHRKARPANQVFWRPKFGDRVIVAQTQIDLGLRTHHRYKLILCLSSAHRSSVFKIRLHIHASYCYVLFRFSVPSFLITVASAGTFF